MSRTQAIKYRRLLLWLTVSAVIIAAVLAATTNRMNTAADKINENFPEADNGFVWQPPDTGRLLTEKNAGLIRYGRDLIANTSLYLGPKGKVAAITNGMNCQNCHLDAGTKKWGNNYSAVFSTYPRFRERSGTVENIYKRVNDCLERSLNGRIIDSGGREMQAMAAYINWLGQKVPKGIKPAGAGIRDLPFTGGQADPFKGERVYRQKCQRCHGSDGNGMFSPDSTKYIYPPLWGEHSYTTGAGLFRLSRFAGYVKDNMPFGALQHEPQLTNEEAWDVAAFVNSQPRPQKNFPKDWPDISGKPIDHPFGPYADGFSEHQHKYGPFAPIAEAKKKK